MNMAQCSGAENAAKRLDPHVSFGIEIPKCSLIRFIIPHPNQTREKRALGLKSGPIDLPIGGMKIDYFKCFHVREVG